MKSVIKNWYMGKDVPFEAQLPASPEERALAREIGESEQHFCAGLTEMQRERYEALSDCRNSAELHRESAIFAQGVSLGLRLAFEAIELAPPDN